MKTEYRIAGFGGQGILFLGQTMAYAAMLAGKETVWTASYGPEMRGGTANCAVVIADQTVRSPLVYQPDVALIFNKPSLERFGPDVKPGGLVLLVAELIDTELKRSDVTVFRVPARRLAEEIGAPKSLNMVMLGALAAVHPTLDLARVEAGVRKITSGSKETLLETNLKAIHQGYYVMRRSKDLAAASKAGV
ncbi:MAG TPA: 2-oxoacid:acceptor oxidoreductase family protein [Bacillota bacterium]|jgi:2-oxoglutarate ferredoxin oxidoreductase subunit gamma